MGLVVPTCGAKEGRGGGVRVVGLKSVNIRISELGTFVLDTHNLDIHSGHL